MITKEVRYISKDNAVVIYLAWFMALTAISFVCNIFYLTSVVPELDYVFFPIGLSFILLILSFFIPIIFTLKRKVIIKE